MSAIDRTVSSRLRYHFFCSGIVAASAVVALAGFLSLSSCRSNPSPDQTDPIPAPDQIPSSSPPSSSPAPSAAPGGRHSPASVSDTLPSFADIVEKARPAVINIYTRVRQVAPRRSHPFFHRMLPRERVQESLGSGFIIDQTGLALTNYHVIRNATDIEVRLFDERRFRAEIVGEDPKTDVALIRLLEHGGDLPVAPLGDSDALRVGEWVIAIGNPLGLTSTVTAGIASATGRQDVPIGGELQYQDFIQTDASINPGNSGGPLLNSKGEVVGVNTAISAEAQGIGFAIPVNMVKEILPMLEKDGRVRRSWLGIYVEDIPDVVRQQVGLDFEGGAIVLDVVPGGPAAIAKLQKGDIILKIGKQPVRDANQLSWIAGNMGIGKTIELQIQRGAQSFRLPLKLGAQPE